MKIGQRVKKISGYTFIGEIRAIFTNRSGEERLVIELVNETGDRNGDKMLHIFVPSQVEPIDEEDRICFCGSGLPVSVCKSNK